MKPHLLTILLGLSVGLMARAEETNLVEQIHQTGGFNGPLTWIGNRPDDGESRALLNALNGATNSPAMGELDEFVAKNPQSAWTPALEHHLAMLDRQRGRYTKALEYWESAWQATRGIPSGTGKMVADSIIGHWLELLSVLGRNEQMKSLLQEIQGRALQGREANRLVETARESLMVMENYPSLTYRCGTFGLVAVARMMRPGDRTIERLIDIPSSPKGFSLTRLTELSREFELGLIPVERGPSRDLVVPSVIHWRQNHYAALVAQEGDNYKVIDPTFDLERWIPRDIINEEASGKFLVPENQKPASWQVLSRAETDQVWGQGFPNGVKDGKDNGGQPPDCHGMPVWWVSEPYINLWMSDKPMAYRTSMGDEFFFQLKLKQRDTITTDILYFPGCEHNWYSYITFEYTTLPPSIFHVNATVYLPGGGEVTFPDGQSVDEASRMRLMRINGGADSILTHGFRLIYPDGRQDVYNHDTDSWHSFLGERIDAYGRTNTVIWDALGSTNRVKYVIDYDGRTNSFRYTNDNLLMEVENPYGQKAQMKYDNHDNLTNVIDAAGLGSAIFYDASYRPTNLTTPYGTTVFSYSTNLLRPGGILGTYNETNDTQNYGGHNMINRAIRVTEPNQGNQLFLYSFDSSTLVPLEYPGEVPTNTPLNTLDLGTNAATVTDYAALSFRNSFHWNQKQYAGLSTTVITNFTSTDYLRGHLSHWLSDSNNIRVTSILSLERDSSPDGTTVGQKTWYDYPGKGARWREGADSHLSVVSRVLPDGTTQYVWNRSNQDGFVTNAVETYSASGGVATRTNLFTYGTNIASYTLRQSQFPIWTNHSTNVNLLLSITNANGQWVASFGGYETNSTVKTNASDPNELDFLSAWGFTQPRFMTNALGEVTQLTYGSQRRLTSLKLPSGLNTTNLYNASGFLTNTAHLEIGRTNSFSYTNGNLNTWKTDLGLTLTFTWDNLLRLTQMAFPDGSSISNRFDNLEVTGRKDRMGNWTQYQYDAMRHLTAITNRLNNVTRFGYCGCGAIESITNALLQVTTLSYNNQQRLTGVTFPDATGVTYNYNLLGQMTNFVDTTGAKITNYFNHQGLLQYSRHAFGQALGAAYDVLDRPTTVTNANGVAVTYTFDALNRLLTRAYPDSGVESFGYSTNGLANYTNQLGKVTRFLHDTAYRTVKVTNANSEVLQFSYNPAGNLTNLVDGLNQSTKWKYDEFGRVTNKVDHLGNTNFVYTYYTNGWLKTRWTPEKGTATNVFDAAGGLLSLNSPHSTNNYLYDALHRVTNAVKVGEFTNSFSYTNYALASEDGPWASDTLTYTYLDQMLYSVSLQQPSAASWAEYFLYDGANRLTNLTASSGTFIYGYDSLRHLRPNQLTLPNLGYITNAFDVAGRLTNTTLKTSANAILDAQTYSINTGNQRTQQARTDGSYVDFTYDDIGQLKSAKGKESGGANRLNEQFGYAYDGAWNLTNRTNNLLVQSFTNNGLNQLTSAGRSGTLTVSGTVTTTATNVTVSSASATNPATLFADATFAATNFSLVNGSNTFTAVGKDAYGRANTNSVGVWLPANVSLAYDLNGNLTNDGNRVFAYDDENQLTSLLVSNAWKSEFSYDAFRRRVVRKEYTWSGGAWSKTNEVRYVYDGKLALQERSTNNTPLVTYTRGKDLRGSRQRAGGIGGLLARTDNTTGKSAFYHADGNGNITAMVNSQGYLAAKYVYDPFGNTVAAAGPMAQVNTMRFSSQELHRNSGLYGFRYRFYEPNYERWLNRDPIGERGGLNLYGYVGNSPINRVDPWGLDNMFSNGGGLIGPNGFLDIGKSSGKQTLDNDYSNGGASAGYSQIYNNAPPNLSVTVTPVTVTQEEPQFSDASHPAPPPRYASDFSDQETVSYQGDDPLTGAFLDAAEFGAMTALGEALGGLLGATCNAMEGTTPLFRAVMNDELADINASGVLRNPAGIENKYFSTTAEGAASYAEQAYGKFGDTSPYTLIQVDAPNSLIPQIIPVDGAIPSLTIPSEALPQLGTPQVLPYAPIPH